MFSAQVPGEAHIPATDLQSHPLIANFVSPDHINQAKHGLHLSSDQSMGAKFISLSNHLCFNLLVLSHLLILVAISLSKERYFKFILWNFQMCKQCILIMFTQTHVSLTPSGTLPTSWPPLKIIQLVFNSGVEFYDGVRATHQGPQPQIKVTIHPPRVINSLYLLSGGLRSPLPLHGGLCNWLAICRSCVVNM